MFIYSVIITINMYGKVVNFYDNYLKDCMIIFLMCW